jgi:AcrR family transcriptional regulator
VDTDARPLRKDAERNRQRILAAAREVFADRGLTATLDDVAAHAGVGVGTVYRRFADKDELIDAVLEESIGDVVRLAEEGLAMDDPWEGLRHFLQEGLQLQASHRGLKELLCTSAHGRPRIAGARERIHPVASQLIERAKAAGVLRADVQSTDFPLLQFMVGSIVDYAGDVDPELWRRFSTIVLDGLRPAREAPTPLPVPALDLDGLDRAMACWRPRPR